MSALDGLWSYTWSILSLGFVCAASSWLLALSNWAYLVATTPRSHRWVNVLLFRSRSWSLLVLGVHCRLRALLLTRNDLCGLILRNISALTRSYLLICSCSHIWLILVTRIAHVTMGCLLGWWLLVLAHKVIIAWWVASTSKLLLVLLLLLLAWVGHWVILLLRSWLLLGLGSGWAWSVTFFGVCCWTLIYTDICWKDARIHLLSLIYLVFRGNSACWFSSTRLRDVLFA